VLWILISLSLLCSLYIRDVPPQTKESDLRELFKSYGAIASVGVPAGRGIAFVDYREEDAMRAALADDREFKLFDKVLHVEERKGAGWTVWKQQWRV
jgi:RNA recognition motif-containing protein